MHLFMFIFVAVLFFILTPGIVVSLPPKSSKTIVAITHAIVFALVWTLIHKSVWSWGVSTGWISLEREGMTLRQCTNKGGRYESGYCYDENNKLLQ